MELSVILNEKTLKEVNDNKMYQLLNYVLKTNNNLINIDPKDMATINDLDIISFIYGDLDKDLNFFSKDIRYEDPSKKLYGILYVITKSNMASMNDITGIVNKVNSKYSKDVSFILGTGSNPNIEFDYYVIGVVGQK